MTHLQRFSGLILSETKQNQLWPLPNPHVGVGLKLRNLTFSEVYLEWTSHFKWHYISFSWHFYPKRLTTTIKKVQFSSRKAKLQSAIGKCHISANKSQLIIFLFSFLYSRCSWKRCVFSLWWKICSLSAVLMSLGSSFHHLGARTANFVECLARSEGATSRLADAEQSERAGV